MTKLFLFYTTILLYGCFFSSGDNLYSFSKDKENTVYEYQVKFSIDTLAEIESIEKEQKFFQIYHPAIQWDRPGYYIFSYMDRISWRLIYFDFEEQGNKTSVYQVPMWSGVLPDRSQNCFLNVTLDSASAYFLNHVSIENMPQVVFLKNGRSYYGESRKFFGYRMKKGSKKYFSLMDFRPDYYEAKDGKFFTLYNIPDPPNTLNRYQELFTILDGKIPVQWPQCDYESIISPQKKNLDIR